jgi:TRAP-type mannitol/chloroaromatic compound transport system permease small subunit
MGLVDAWGGNTFGWLAAQLIEAPYNIITALMSAPSWLAWVPHMQLSGRIEDPVIAESLIRFIYFGASWRLLFALSFLFILVTVVGMFRHTFMWGCVRGLEGFGNTVGRVAAWAGLLMVLQQILIVFVQRVFAVAEISLGFGMAFTHDVSWWSEELKLYNAMIVCLCVSYTFIQGGHVRVDLVYSVVSYRTKRIIDMMGCMVFMIPGALVTYFYGWFFLWRTLITPNFSGSDTFKDLDQLLPKARALRWNVETIGFSPNGFNAYFLFKVLLLVFALMVILQAIAFFYRSYLELREGPTSEGRHLDKDTLGDPTADLVAKIH